MPFFFQILPYYHFTCFGMALRLMMNDEPFDSDLDSATAGTLTLDSEFLSIHIGDVNCHVSPLHGGIFPVINLHRLCYYILSLILWQYNYWDRESRHSVTPPLQGSLSFSVCYDPSLCPGYFQGRCLRNLPFHHSKLDDFFKFLGLL